MTTLNREKEVKLTMRYWRRMVVNRVFFILCVLSLGVFDQSLLDCSLIRSAYAQSNETYYAKCEKHDCKLPPNFLKHFNSKDESGKYDLYFVSFPEYIYTESNIRCIPIALSELLKKNKRIKIFLFDNPTNAKLAATGKIRGQDLPSFIRGIYHFAPQEEEYIEYASHKGEVWNTNKIIFK